MQRILCLALFVFGGALAGCTYDRSGPPAMHLADWKSEPPRGNTITVCSAYGCQKRSRVMISQAELQEIIKLMKKVKKSSSPYEERRAVAYAVGLLERQVGEKIGTKADRPGMDYAASGDPTQQDCVDEATNTTAYLMFLDNKGLIKQHTVEHPISKGNLLKGTLQGSPVKYWPHWTAVLKEKETGEKYAVDSWIHENGENPAVVKLEEWYIEDLSLLPKPTT